MVPNIDAGYSTVREFERIANYFSVGTIIGIRGALIVGKWVVPDPIAAVILSFFIFKAALDLSYEI